MITVSGLQIEMTLEDVERWQFNNSSKSEFARNLNPIHFAGYTEDEINGIALERDELLRQGIDHG
jgi:hypothetical protein